MFDIKNLTLKDWIIGVLFLLIIALGYKYYTSQNEIKKLSNEIESLKKKIESGNKLINLESVISSSESDSDSDSPEPNNYKTNKTIETFNNNKNQEIECDDDICWISGRNAKNQPKQVPIQNQMQIPVPIQNQVPVHVQMQSQVIVSEQNQVPVQSNILPPIQQEELDMMKDITSFLTMADCVVNEVDEIVGNNIYIPVNLKKIVNEIYESPETAYDEESKFNPVILDSNDVINVKPDQIDSKIDMDIDIQSVDTKNIPSHEQWLDALRESDRTSVPFGALRESDRTSVPFGALRESDRTSVPFGALRESDRTSVPFGALRESDRTSVPDFINIPLTLGCTPETNDVNVISESKTVIKPEIETNEIIESEAEEIQSETQKIKSMKINDLKNLARKLNIKLTEHSRPKNRDQLIAEINKFQSVNSQKNI
jgi:hypothetical protein